MEQFICAITPYDKTKMEVSAEYVVSPVFRLARNQMECRDAFVIEFAEAIKEKGGLSNVVIYIQGLFGIFK